MIERALIIMQLPRGKIKIGIFCPRDLTKVGGTPIRVLGISKYVSNYCDVTIFSNGRLPEEIANKVTHIQLKPFYFLGYCYLLALAFPKLRKPLSIILSKSPGALQIINSDYDLLHCAQHGTAFIAIMLRNKIKAPLLFDMHGLLQSEVKLNPRYSIENNILYPILEKTVLLESDAISTPSEAMSSYIASEFGIPSERLFTIPDGVDLELFENNEFDKSKKIRMDLGLLDKKVVMYIGRISPLHDSINLIKSFHLVNKQLKDMKGKIAFVLVAHEPDPVIKERYKELTHGLNNLVQHGPIPHCDLPAYLKAADILVIPYANDAFSNMVPHLKTFEYMVSGTPIVAARTRGNEEILIHEKNAILVDPESPESMADGIVKLLINDELNRKIRENAKKNANEKYSWEYSAKKAVEAYKTVLVRWNK